MITYREITRPELDTAVAWAAAEAAARGCALVIAHAARYTGGEQGNRRAAGILGRARAIARAEFPQLVVETEKCPLILNRILEVIRDHDALPFTIATRRNTSVQIVEMELIAPPQRPALAILQDLRRLSNVRFARFLLPADQDQQPVVAAKV